VFVSDVDGQNDIYSMNLDGADWKRLTHKGGYNPKHSPDGTRIVFNSEFSGNHEIYVMNADGSGLVQLTDDPAADYQPDWSPDGSQIVFISSRDGTTNLYVMNADGSNQRTLVDTPDAGERTPAWSPDGDKILFTQVVDGSGDGKITNLWVDVRYLCVLYSETMSINCITEPSEHHHTSDPVWHPNSYTFLFGSLEKADPTWRIWEMNIDGTGARRLIASANSDVPEAFSSDGSKFLFRSWRHGHWEVFMANADGGNQALLTDNQDNNRSSDWIE
jgi:TolB protein